MGRLGCRYAGWSWVFERKNRIPTTRATVADVCMTSAFTGMSGSKRLAMSIVTPNEMHTAAHESPTCLIAWYITNARMVTANPTAIGPRSRVDRPVDCSHQIRPIERARPIEADVIIAGRWRSNRLASTAYMTDVKNAKARTKSGRIVSNRSYRIGFWKGFSALIRDPIGALVFNCFVLGRLCGRPKPRGLYCLRLEKQNLDAAINVCDEFRRMICHSIGVQKD